MQKFVHLHVHSHYSLLDGLAKIPELVSRAKELGMESLALTDHGVLYGAIEFYKTATKAGIKPIIGVEAYIAPRDRFSKEPNERYYHLILLCENETGWKNLIKLVTKSNLEGFYYHPRMDKDILKEYHEGLIALSGCLGGQINQTLLSGNFEEAKKIALEYQEIFGKNNFFIEIQKHTKIAESEKIEPFIIKLSQETGIPLVATQDLHYIKKEDGQYHEILLAIQTGNKLSDDDRMSFKEEDFSMNSPEEMIEKFSHIPGDPVSRTLEIAERCNLKFDLGNVLLPNFPKPEGKTANQYLRELLKERISKKIPEEQQTEEIKQRLEYETSVIEKTGFADYFLIVQDLIHWAKIHNIAVGPGRGSAAGSLVSYVLDITDLNPMNYGLIFERFLNPERIQMPDIDIDFADTRRDEVLAYAREKYGEDKVARIITFGTMAARAAIRDAGRAMGYAYSFCDQIAKLIPFNPTQGMKEGWLDESLKKITELRTIYETNPDAKRLIDTARHLEGVARHVSVHACGTVIAKEPLTERVPLQYAPQEKNIIITQFEMHAIEELGLLKIDFLGLKNLTIIENTLHLIKQLKGIDLDISKIALDDKKTLELLRRADTMGVFQFESSGMRRYMKEMQLTEFEDLIALVALFRPGPMDLIPTFIKRKKGLEKITYLHPKLEPILKNTYGIGVYQEQMMQIARDCAGYTLPEADMLRKAIGKKIKSLLDEQKEKLVSGMIKNGIDKKTALEIWELFPPFARYGFNKSHAACYALIGYQTAYLKANYQEEFLAGLFNAEMDDIERISLLVQEAKQSNIEILGPDVNKSFVDFTPENGLDKQQIRFGLLAVKNVGSEITKAIIEERLRNGEFKNIEDFLTRIKHKDLNKKSIESLIKSGAFDSLGVERKQALENITEFLRFTTANKKITENNQNSLFGEIISQPQPLKLNPTEKATEQEKLIWEKELIGFYLSKHPLEQYTEKLKAYKARPISEILLITNERLIVRVAGIISKVNKIFTKNGQPMLFATIEDSSQNTLEIVVFNSVLEKTISVWKENSVVIVEGRISNKDGQVKMLCDNAKELK